MPWQSHVDWYRKIHADGRHAYTGGGNHDNGWADTVREPVFASRHSAKLYYLLAASPWAFLFVFEPVIGPTSQAPRVDEAGDERLYELEIAFSQIPDGEVPQFG